MLKQATIPPNSLAARGIQLPPRRGDAPVVHRRSAAASGSPVKSSPWQTGASTSSPYFDALRESNDRQPVPAGYFGQFRSILNSLSRERIAALGDYLYDNVPVVFTTVETICNYSAGIRLAPATPDAAVNVAYARYWAEWCKRADFYGGRSLDTLARIACRYIDRHGDIGAAMTSKRGLPQVQLFEAWRISGQDEGERDGIRKDSEGVATAFVIDGGKAEFPAGSFILLSEHESTEAGRGISPLRRGSNDVRDAAEIKGFAKLSTKISAAIPAVIEGGPVMAQDFGFTTAEEYLSAKQEAESTGSDIDSVADQRVSIWELLGGEIPALQSGQRLAQLENKNPGPNVIEFLRTLSGSFVMGTGLPPAFIIDEGLTGPNQRAVNGRAQRKFDSRQEEIARFYQWAYTRVIAWGIAFDGLPAVPDFWASEWSGPARVTIDAGRESAQERDDVEKRLMSRQEHFGNRAYDWRQQTDQMFIEDEYILDRAAEQAKRKGVPLDLILARWGFAPSAPQPAPQPAQQPPQPQ